ncbi:beta-N-acetylhexosaminidase [Microbacterium sp.]|uniref:beta-N-acetylhexosaminidase n=1 Tax=Microbacterium sp. TaxID=51671 RepID=UPI0028125B14|nr:beta-N-acetylhexosaminidase [Microbacterium sp.]
MVLPDPLPLVPAPLSAISDAGRTRLSDSTRVIGDASAAAALIERVAARCGIRIPLVAGEPRPGDVVLRLDATSGPAEAYRLRVGDVIEITGADAAGLFYGIQTLLQLLREDDEGWGWQRVRIEDAPRFAYRGMMLDVARHFFPVAEVKAVIDRAAALKLNHVHLHLSDDQGWRLHIDSWPLLSQMSSVSSANGDQGGCYSKDDYREIVAHAASRHVTIVPEIDLPGHTHAIGLAYPELVEDPVMNDHLLADAARLGQALPVAGEPYTGWGVGHSSVRIRQERTWRFVRDALTELAELTPGPYLHIGGDESLGTSKSDFAYFMERATALVVEIGKTPVAWHEAGAVDRIAEGTVGQYWGRTSPEGTHAAEAAHFVHRGGRLILSPADASYLDMKYSDDFPLGLSWAGVTDVRDAYDWEPAAVLPVDDEAILGVEAPLWTETVRSLHDADQLTHPRIAAVAELAWTSADNPERRIDSLRHRIGRQALLWQSDGIRYHPIAEIPWSTR